MIHCVPSTLTSIPHSFMVLPENSPHLNGKVHAQLLSYVQLFATLWTVACQAPQSMGFSSNWSGWPCPPPDPDPGMEPRYSTLRVDSLLAEPSEKPKNTGMSSLSLLQGIFLTQELNNQGLLHCRRILYQLSYQDFLKTRPFFW